MMTISFKCFCVINLFKRIHIFLNGHLSFDCVVVLDFSVILERWYLALGCDKPVTWHWLSISPHIMLVICRLWIPIKLLSEIFGLRLPKAIHEIILRLYWSGLLVQIRVSPDHLLITLRQDISELIQMLLTVLSLHHWLCRIRLQLLHVLSKIKNLLFLCLLMVAVEKWWWDGVF